MADVVKVQGLTKRYAGFRLSDISFSLPEGYIMGLIGPNGAGKTTVIKMIMNLIRRDHGEIQIFGQDNLAAEAEVKSAIGFVYDEPHFYEDVPLRRIAKAYARFYRTWDDRLFDALAAEFDLPLRKTPKTLSRGMRTKLALALAFAHHPRLLIMDEPTSGLDPAFRRGLLAKLADFVQDGRHSVIFSTHLVADLEDIADYVTFINRGRLFFAQTLEEVRDTWAVVKGGRELLAPEWRPLLAGIQNGSFGVEGLTRDAERFRALRPAECSMERAGLEEIMYFVSQEEADDYSAVAR